MSERIRVLLVDDQTLFVEGLKMVLASKAEDIVLVGIAYNGREGLDLALREKPDVVLMDIRMPVMDGVESTRLIREQLPDTRVLILTTFDDDEYVIEALKLGAVGYILKDIPPAELISAIRAVHEGGVLIAPKVAAKIAEKLAGARSGGKGSPPESAPPLWLQELSPREQEVLRLLAGGYDNREIAASLFLAEQTVKNHVVALYDKMDVKDRVHAMRKAAEMGVDAEKY